MTPTGVGATSTGSATQVVGTPTATPTSTAVATATPTAGGPLAITQPGEVVFPAIRITGESQIMSTMLDGFTVDDPRGVGWHVVIRASQMAEVDPISRAVVDGGKTLPRRSLSLDQPRLAGATNMLPTISIMPGTFLIDEGTDVPLVPASVFARTYRTNITVSVVAGP
ncbi:MAG: hypothetical protein NVS4B8_25320 [Herpetosiphon sp.]